VTLWLCGKHKFIEKKVGLVGFSSEIQKISLSFQ